MAGRASENRIEKVLSGISINKSVKNRNRFFFGVGSETENRRGRNMKLKIFRQAQTQGFFRSRNQKHLNVWYGHCKLNGKLFVCIKDASKYCMIEADAICTSYNFTELGITRILDIGLSFNDNFHKLKKGASFSAGKTYVYFSGFPKEDAVLIAEKIIDIWNMPASKVSIRT